MCSVRFLLLACQLPLTMQRLTFKDQMGEAVDVPYPPTRIISLVPSQTELLADLGLSSEVIGVTRFCVRPESWLKSKTIIGGTKQFNFDRIDSLNPDLIIGNKEENYQEGIIALKEKYPVWMSDILSFKDSLSMIESVGALTNRNTQAGEIKSVITQSFQALKPYAGQSVLYLIWRKPWMAAGTNTFIDSMLIRLGLKNIMTSTRYPELTSTAIAQLNPEFVFLSSEPYPFQRKHVTEIQQLCPSAKILLVDGEMFSWYGSRLMKAPEYFKTLPI